MKRASLFICVPLLLIFAIASSSSVAQPVQHTPAVEPRGVAVDSPRPQLLLAQAGKGGRASDGLAGFREVNAAPAQDPSGATAAVVGEEDPVDERPFGITVVMEHAASSALFMQNEYLANRGTLVQSWNVRPSYSFDVLGHRLTASLRFLFDVYLTDTNNNPDDRFWQYDTRLSLGDAEIYQEPFTEITLYGGVHWFFPTQEGTWKVRRQWGALAGYLGLRRSIGPVDLDYAFTATKYFNTSRSQRAYGDVSARAPVNVPLTRGLAESPGTWYAGTANLSSRLINTATVTWNILEWLNLGYSLTVYNDFGYNRVGGGSSSLYGDVAPIYGDNHGSRSDFLWPTLEVGVTLSEALASVADFPFQLALALGATALHPAQMPDNSRIVAPVIFNNFGNRAPYNYTSVYLDVIGTY